MADKVFLIHGMGSHPDGWVAPVVAAIDELYARYPNLARRPRAERFELIPVGYDSVFRQIVDRWRQDASSIGPLAAGVGASEVASLVGWLRETDGFAWTHAADVLLYRLFFNVRQAVKAEVGRQILAHVATKSASESWSVIAHSLGTAVAHDTLHMLFTATLDDGSPTAFSPLQQQARLVMMVANTSRVLETAVDVYESSVKPGPAGAADRGCGHLFVARHLLDPFTIPRMFNPVDWPDAAGVQTGIYRFLQVRHVHAKNVHGLEHYLAHPEVHVPLFRALTFDAAVTQDQEAAARTSFSTFGTLGETRGLELQRRLEKVTPAISDTWRQMPVLWDRFAEYLSAA